LSKKKRIRRDIEKCIRTGRYWELLHLLEDEGLTAEYAREQKEAWKTVVKQALKSERAFEQFLHEVDSFKKGPVDPDFHFLKLLKEFIEERSSADEILQLKGLSADAERIKSKVAAFASQSSNFAKLKTVLEKFLREPQKITRRFFHDLAILLPATALRTAVNRLGEWIPVARSFNHKAAVARGWAGVDYMSLERLDSRVAHISYGLPPALREILLLPFLHNLAVMCRRLSPTAGSHNAAQLVRSIPSLIRGLAGEKIGDVERELLIRHGDWVENRDGGGGSLEERMPAMSLEEKLVLLSGLRARAVERRPEAPAYGDKDFYDQEDDEDDIDDLFDDSNSRPSDLAHSLMSVHRSILGDISVRAPKLSSREQKDLVGVMEPVLLRDLDYILDHLPYFEDVVPLLEDAMDSGCAGTRMGLLVLLAGGVFRKTDLRRRAGKQLDRSAPPSVDDMKWLAGHWNALFYPKARALRPLFQRYGGDATLLSPFSVQVCKLVEGDVIEHMISPALLRFSLSPFSGPALPKPEAPGILRRELDDLSEFAVLDPVRHFLRCYGEDRITLEGNLCWLNAWRAMRPDAVWEMALKDLKRYETIHAHTRSMLQLRELNTLVSEKVQAFLLFMKEHLDEVAMLPMGELEAVLGGLLKYHEVLRDHNNLLVHMNNRLNERLRAGEVGVRPMLETLKKTLLDLARTHKKTSRPSKRKR
jgi:hypothetical protein